LIKDKTYLSTTWGVTTHSTYIEAARREKRFKNWRKQWKINLIEEPNPEWHELYKEICS